MQNRCITEEYIKIKEEEKRDLSEFENSLKRLQKASNDILKEFNIQKENNNLKHKSSEVEKWFFLIARFVNVAHLQ